MKQWLCLNFSETQRNLSHAIISRNMPACCKIIGTPAEENPWEKTLLNASCLASLSAALYIFNIFRYFRIFFHVFSRQVVTVNKPEKDNKWTSAQACYFSSVTMWIKWLLRTIFHWLWVLVTHPYTYFAWRHLYSFSLFL